MSIKSGQEKKFYNLPINDRLTWVKEIYGLSDEEIRSVSGESGLSLEDADHMIENVVGVYGLPMGIAQHFRVNGRDVPVPMVVEEPSIVAGASFMAKLALKTGGFFAHSTAPEMIGQIQVLDIDDLSLARLKILDEKESLIALAAEVDPVLKKLGGGPKDLEIRMISESPIGPFMVLHLIYDVRDAMGANAVNTAVERLASKIEQITGGRVLLRILSNLADKRLTRSQVTIQIEDLAFSEFTGEQVRDGIIEAWANLLKILLDWILNSNAW